MPTSRRRRACVLHCVAQALVERRVQHFVPRPDRYAFGYKRIYKMLQRVAKALGLGRKARSERDPEARRQRLDTIRRPTADNSTIASIRRERAIDGPPGPGIPR